MMISDLPIMTMVSDIIKFKRKFLKRSGHARKSEYANFGEINLLYCSVTTTKFKFHFGAKFSKRRLRVPHVVYRCLFDLFELCPNRIATDGGGGNIRMWFGIWRHKFMYISGMVFSLCDRFHQHLLWNFSLVLLLKKKMNINDVAFVIRRNMSCNATAACNTTLLYSQYFHQNSACLSCVGRR